MNKIDLRDVVLRTFAEYGINECSENDLTKIDLDECAEAVVEKLTLHDVRESIEAEYAKFLTSKIDIMKWISIKNELPPVNELVLMLWRNINGELVCSVSSRSRITRHCGEGAPIDDRYWIFTSRVEIEPVYWRYLPQFPPAE